MGKIEGVNVENGDRLYDELSRVNNELINAQRELIQRSMKIERAEQLLRNSHDSLERQIKERTSELEGYLAAFQKEARVRKLAEDKLRMLSLRLLRLQDEERRRVARDLHDTVGQTLTALKITLSMLHTDVKTTATSDSRFADLNQLADQALAEIRTTSYLLHPPLLDEAGFESAASWYIDGFNKRSSIKVRLSIPTGVRFSSHVEIVLFRILQEGLTNITKHSGTAEVDVLLEVGESGTILSIRDYGKGIDTATLAKMNESGSVGVGVAGMRERLKELGGTLEIQSDSTGTTLRAFVPSSLENLENH
jgi:two-component system NarL family sensor kinase